MQPQPVPPFEPRVIGRYALYDEIASGGMATVHLGRLLGEAGFSRTVAIKRLHPQFAKDPDFVAMFIDEARVAARIHHPNVVPTLDVAFTNGELYLVMEYVMGESLSKLIPATRARGERIQPAVAATVMAGVLHGLHAAHEALDERGVPLGIVHRDVSPQNVLVGVDGTGRVLDFGVAKAVGRIQTTRDGQLKGKIAYMAPEQIRGVVERTTDVYAASVVLWETLTGKRLFQGDSEAEAMKRVLEARVQPPSAFAPDVPLALDAIVLRGLDVDPSKRFPTAGEMALAIEDAVPLVAASRVGRWVRDAAAERIAVRAERIAAMESSSAIRAPRADVPRASVPDATPPPTSGSFVGAPPGMPAAAFAAAPATFPVRAPMPAAAPRAAAWIAGLLAGMVFLSAAAVILFFVWQRSVRRAAAVAPVAVTASTTATTTATAIETATATATATGATTTPSAAPTASEAAPVASVPSVTLTSLPVARPGVAAPPRAASPRSTTAAASARAAVDCNPPFYFNAKGDRIFKPECL